jgi:hypothetical protein
VARRRVVAGAGEVRRQVAGEEVEVVVVHLPSGLLGEEGAEAGPPNLWSRDRLSTNCLLCLIFILFLVQKAGMVFPIRQERAPGKNSQKVSI